MNPLNLLAYLLREAGLLGRNPSFTFVAASAILLSPQVARAGSATWDNNPSSGDWNTAQNWMPLTVPNGPADVASFGISALTEISLSAPTTVDGIIYQAGGSAFTISVSAPEALTFTGTGVTNNSGVTQNFVTNLENSDDSGVISFRNSATAGSMALFTNNASGVSGERGGATEFFGHSSAGSAMFINNGMPPAISGSGGRTEFHGNSTAANGTFINNPNVFAGGFMQFFDSSNAGNGSFTSYGGQVSFAGGSTVFFNNESSAGSGTFLTYGPTAAGGIAGFVVFNNETTADHGVFTAQGGTVNGEGGGAIVFFDTSTAADGSFTINGGTVSGAAGGEIDFDSDSTAGNSTIIINGGKNGGGGGDCQFANDAEGGTARIAVFGNGTLTLFTSLTVGSIEGTGEVLVSGPTEIGSNNLSTRFSGVILFFAPVTKIGAGTWTLSGANKQSSRVTVQEGALVINNRAGSGTGSGPVLVSAGTLGGRGIIAGAVTVGSGSGTGAVLAPGEGARRPATLTLLSELTFRPDGTYNFRLNTKRGESDQVIANRITIESGADFDFNAIANKPLTAGAVFTAISNTSANPITGTFVNLADNSIVTVGGNTFQVDYEGGDGNDLTLTVVP